MRISELAEQTDSSVSTVKYYLREGLLPPGESRGATQSAYGPEHVRRMKTIKALTDVAGLPIQKVRVVLGLIDAPGNDPFATLGSAVGALPPYLPDAPPGARSSGTGDPDYPLARAALRALGQVYDPHYAAVAQLERALRAVADAGLPMSGRRMAAYGKSLMAMAEFDISALPSGSSATVEHAVLGTALYEPVILALRRLAHQDAAARRLGAAAD